MKFERVLLPAVAVVGAGVLGYAQLFSNNNDVLSSPNGKAFLETLNVLEKNHLTPVNRENCHMSDMLSI